MTILEKSNCILFYSVDPKYFEKFNEVYCEKSGRSYWVTTESNSYLFTYTTSFYAKDKDSDELFLECKTRLVCRVRIEDEKEDARQMLTFVKELHDSMGLFIEKNSLSYYSKLNLPEYQISDPGLAHMEMTINGLKDKVKFEDKSEYIKQLEEQSLNCEIKTQVLKIKKAADENGRQ